MLKRGSKGITPTFKKSEAITPTDSCPARFFITVTADEAGALKALFRNRTEVTVDNEYSIITATAAREADIAKKLSAAGIKPVSMIRVID